MRKGGVINTRRGGKEIYFQKETGKEEFRYSIRFKSIKAMENRFGKETGESLIGRGKSHLRPVEGKRSERQD